MEDEILIKYLRKNDRKAYSILFDKYFERLFTFAVELPEKCREVCRRRFFEGKKFEEIAEELDISESTARVQTHRGMEMLRQRFAEYDLAVILFFIPFL